MDTVYFYCAVVGGTLLVIQTILLVIAGGGHTDTDFDADVDADFDAEIDAHDASGDAFVKILSLKTVVAFLTFFGLSGLACLTAELSATLTMMVALVAGFVAVYVVANMMAALNKLQSRGNIDLTNAVGQSGRVYLRIPSERSGSGRVTVSVQGRRLEARAITPGTEIPTGTQVIVVSCLNGNTLEVEPMTPKA